MAFSHERDRIDRIERQRFLLAELQANQQAVLESRGIAQKGRQTIIDRNKLMPSGESQDSVDEAQVAVAQQRGKLRLVFTTRKTFGERVAPVHTYVDVAHRLGDVVEAMHGSGFTDEETTVMANLFDDVIAEKDAGRLPNLSPDGTSIIDPAEGSIFD